MGKKQNSWIVDVITSQNWINTAQCIGFNGRLMSSCSVPRQLQHYIHVTLAIKMYQQHHISWLKYYKLIQKSSFTIDYNLYYICNIKLIIRVSNTCVLSISFYCLGQFQCLKNYYVVSCERLLFALCSLIQISVRCWEAEGIQHQFHAVAVLSGTTVGHRGSNDCAILRATNWSWWCIWTVVIWCSGIVVVWCF